MTPGPTIIKKCSACAKLVEQDTIGSGNTFGATFWTDGKREAPMLPDQLWLVICPHCRAPLWIDELEVLGQVDPWGNPDKAFDGARGYQAPTLQDYLAFLDKGVAASEKERYVRLRAWWTGNDQRRTDAGGSPMSAGEKANLAAFVLMLNESEDGDLVMKVEAMRELGLFDQAISLSARPVDPQLAQAVSVIRNLAEAADPCVRKMSFE